MIEVAIMLEGQNGLNWPRWQSIARVVEDLGFAGLYRSDHFTNSNPPDLDSLELWVSLTWLASHTQRIEFGPLVSPVSFRDPRFTARMAIQVDNLSNGRLRLGLGSGWQEREHSIFGYDLLDLHERFERFTEGLEVISHLMQSDQPVDFAGKYYQLRGAVLLPRPERPGGPPIVIGGNGVKQTLPRVARFAAEWNAVDTPVEKWVPLNRQLDGLLQQQGRDPKSVRRTLMTTLLFGRDANEVKAKMGQRDEKALRERGVVFGTGAEVKEQIQRLGEAGLQRVMLRWLDLDDVKGLEALAHAVL